MIEGVISLPRVLLLLMIATQSSILGAQEKVAPSQAVVRGRFLQSSSEKHQIPFSEFKIQLVEQVVLPDADPPANWAEMTPSLRTQYVEDFKKSPEGLKLLAKREKILADRNVFPVNIEDDGKWVVYDVPAARYGIVNGRVDRKVDGRNYAYELFGQFEVSDKVEEVILDPIEIMVTPLLVAGEIAPDFQVKTESALAVLSPQQFQGRYVVLYFWSTLSEPSVQYHAELQKMVEAVKSKHRIDLVSINLDKDPATASSAIKKNDMGGFHGFAGGLRGAAAQDYGVRSLPSQWLIGKDGKLLLTNMDFRRLAMSGKTLQQIVTDRIEGRLELPPDPSEGK